jgi:hypothetical protein
MMNESGVSGIFSFAELNYLRMEAMDLFERCLTEGDPKLLEIFVEQQISQDPPRLELLREVAEDLHHRMLELHANRYDVRERMIRVLREDFGIEAGALLPLSSLRPDQALSLNDTLSLLQERDHTLSEQDFGLIRKRLDATQSLEFQLHRDVMMTQYLYNYVMDWVMGLNAIHTQRYWARARHAPFHDPQH